MGDILFECVKTRKPSRVSTLTLRQSGLQVFIIQNDKESLSKRFCDAVWNTVAKMCGEFEVDSYAIHFFVYFFL